MAKKTSRCCGPAAGDLIVMTPIIQGTDENVIRVQRYQHDEQVPGEILHIAGGQHTGIVVRQHKPEETDDDPTPVSHMQLDFSVFLVDASTGAHKEERRMFQFWFYDECPEGERHAAASQYFKALLTSVNQDYVGFIKHVLKLLQSGYPMIRRLDLDMRLVGDADAPPHVPGADSSSEIEAVTMAHVQDILEQAYPKSISLVEIAELLRCTVEVVETFLQQLITVGIVRRLDATGEWIRCDETEDAAQSPRGSTVSSDHNKSTGAESPTFDGPAVNGTEPSSGGKPHLPPGAVGYASVGGPVRRKDKSDKPTVAIITALFVEKMAVDAMMEDKRILRRYQSNKADGESNIYTVGRIGEHRVVLTKLSMVGHSRTAMTAAGSITTRLLGTFQDIEHVLIVGCGGAVAHLTDPDRHVRLGDVVVSAGRDAYVFCDKLEVDRITEQVRGFMVKRWTQHDQSIPNVLQQLQAENEGSDPFWHPYCARVEEQLNRDVKGTKEYTFSRPAEGTDQLGMKLGDGSVLVLPHPNKERVTPKLHMGTVAGGRGTIIAAAQRSGDSAKLMDQFAEMYGCRAFDGDFDSVVESIHGNRIDSWALVRGAAEYNGDGLRTKDWQAYAALQAAAVAKCVIERLPAPQT